MWHRQWSWFVRVWKLNQNLGIDGMMKVARETLEVMQEQLGDSVDGQSWAEFERWAKDYFLTQFRLVDWLEAPENENNPQRVGVVPEPSEQTEGDVLVPVSGKRVRE